MLAAQIRLENASKQFVSGDGDAGRPTGTAPAPQRADDVCTAHPGRGAPLLAIRWVQNPHPRSRTPSVGQPMPSGSSRARPAAGTTRLGQEETCRSGKSFWFDLVGNAGGACYLMSARSGRAPSTEREPPT